ncbi:MAG: NAD(P)-dependent oxidoreductase [Halieaceae bacterium]|nr:NAD(P)-dependent oxidoreductase [Halieaceae bacterium]
MSNRLKVGYIGLGNIGKPAAKRLLCDAFQTYVYDIVPSSVDELVALGALGCTSPAQVARACSHIGVCVRDDAQVESVLYGAQGILPNAAPGAVIAIHSTVTHAALIKWAADADAAGLQLIDAPVTGGAQGAEAGTLCYMVGGDIETLARVSPVFETSAATIIHAGELGTGIVLKLCNNLITYAEFMAMSEATRLAEAVGLSADTLREVGKSNGVVNESMHQFIGNRNALARTCTEAQMDEIFGPFGRLGEKDLDCALTSAGELGVDLPSTENLRKSVLALFLNKA